MTGVQFGPGAEHGLVGGHVLARPADRLPGVDGLEDPDRVVVDRLGVLDHHHCICADRHRRAGHDAHCVARTDLDGRGLAGCDRARDPQRRRGLGGVGGDHRKAVDRSVVERRHELAGHDRLGRDQAECVSDGDVVDAQWCALADHVALRFGEGNHGRRSPRG